MATQQGPSFDFTVDGEPLTTTEHILTPTRILELAGKDPQTRYLVQVIGRNQESYQDRPNEELHMHQGMTFISIASGPTPVA